jgi:hypothetical protein
MTHTGWIADAAFAYGDAVEHHFSRCPRPLETPPEKKPPVISVDTANRQE